MQERIVEIIVYLLSELQQERRRKDKVDLTRSLHLKGYTEIEINLAFAWIFKHLRKPPLESAMRGSGEEQDYDEMADLESLIISPDAYGYLIQLLHLGIMKDRDMETFIERALAYGKDDISVDDLKSIVASIIFDTDTAYMFGGYTLYDGDVPLQ
jgi:uncharacterized protein Smg (DUF494 family)